MLYCDTGSLSGCDELHGYSSCIGRRVKVLIIVFLAFQFGSARLANVRYTFELDPRTFRVYIYQCMAWNDAPSSNVFVVLDLEGEGGEKTMRYRGRDYSWRVGDVVEVGARMRGTEKTKERGIG